MDAVDQKGIAKRIAARFRKPWHRDYARAKLRIDPVYAAAAAVLGDSGTPLLDIGCGLGLLGFYLRERGFRGDYLGLDFDGSKINAARTAMPPFERLTFEEDTAQSLPPFRGHVALIDVLHYLERDDQQALLREAAARVTCGGSLVMRSVLRDRGWRFRATVAEEFLLYATRWMRSRARHYPSREEIEGPLRAAGLDTDVQPLWGNTPFNSFVVVARRPV